MFGNIILVAVKEVALFILGLVALLCIVTIACCILGAIMASLPKKYTDAKPPFIPDKPE